MTTEVTSTNGVNLKESNEESVNETTKSLNNMNLKEENNDQEIDEEDEGVYEEKDIIPPSAAEGEGGVSFDIKHPLQNRWTLWYDNPGKKTNSSTWGASLKRVVTFDTVEDFWRIFNNIRPATKLVLGSNYHLFKDHIEPKWEDKENTKGGQWVAPCKGKRETMDKMWLWAVLACIGESFEDDSEICGVVVSVRKTGDRIALWTKNSNNEMAQKRIGQQFKKVLELPDNLTIGFTSHADSIKSGSRSKAKYEL